MAVKKVVEASKREIAFLVEVDPEYVSLVRHGANQQPFRIVKSHKEGGDAMTMVVQSILLPKHVKLEELAAKKGLEWLSEAKTDSSQEHGDYQKLHQLAVEKFDNSSLNLVKLDKSGTFALVGQLQDERDAKEALTIGKELTEKMPSAPMTAMEAPVAEIQSPAYLLTFGDVFDSELGSFLNVVRGALSQSGSDKQQRKKMVMSALDAFKSFLSIGLDAIGEEAVKIEKSDVTPETEGAEGGKQMFQFESEQQFTEKVAEIVSAEVQKAMKPVVEEQQAATEKAEKAEKPAETAPDAMKVVLDNVAELTNSVKSLTEKIDKLEQQPAADPAAPDSEEETRVSKSDASTTEKGSVFAGLLTPKAVPAA